MWVSFREKGDYFLIFMHNIGFYLSIIGIVLTIISLHDDILFSININTIWDFNSYVFSRLCENIKFPVNFNPIWEFSFNTLW